MNIRKERLILVLLHFVAHYTVGSLCFLLACIPKCMNLVTKGEAVIVNVGFCFMVED